MDQAGTPQVMGTMISDLQNGPSSAADNDLVNQIFQAMETPSSMQNPVMTQNTGMSMGSLPPPAGARMPMVVNNQPAPMPTMPHTADPTVATAHMIGSAHPTQADFQQMMMASNGYGMAQAYAPYNGMPMNGPVVDTPKKNWSATWIDELRQPFVVMIVIFVITMPWFHLLTTHYTPSLLKASGEFTTLGLLFRAGIGGTLYWFLQHVVAPLIVI
jgi:hypothetical protein